MKKTTTVDAEMPQRLHKLPPQRCTLFSTVSGILSVTSDTGMVRSLAR